MRSVENAAAVPRPMPIIPTDGGEGEPPDGSPTIREAPGSLARAKERRAYAAKNLARARTELTDCTPCQERSLYKLEGDLAAAERDVAWCQHQLEDALVVEGLSD